MLSNLECCVGPRMNNEHRIILVCYLDQVYRTELGYEDSHCGSAYSRFSHRFNLKPLIIDSAMAERPAF